MDGDNITDLVAANRGDNSVTVCLGTTGSGLIAGQTFATSGPAPGTISCVRVRRLRQSVGVVHSQERGCSAANRKLQQEANFAAKAAAHSPA